MSWQGLVALKCLSAFQMSWLSCSPTQSLWSTVRACFPKEVNSQSGTCRESSLCPSCSWCKPTGRKSDHIVRRKAPWFTWCYRCRTDWAWFRVMRQSVRPFLMQKVFRARLASPVLNCLLQYFSVCVIGSSCLLRRGIGFRSQLLLEQSWFWGYSPRHVCQELFAWSGIQLFHSHLMPWNCCFGARTLLKAHSFR